MCFKKLIILNVIKQVQKEFEVEEFCNRKPLVVYYILRSYSQSPVTAQIVTAITKQKATIAI